MSDPSAMDVPSALRNVLALLQQDPLRYRNFGVYWWPVKSLLTRQYGPEQLYCLKGYIEPGAEALIAETGLEAVLRAAFAHYSQRAAYGLGSSDSATHDGEPYTLFDPDVEA